MICASDTFPNQMLKTNGWAYASDERAETYSGPVATHEEAIAEALAEYEDADSVVIARAVYPNPIAEIARLFSLDTVMEQMEEIAEDGEWWSGDDALFELKGSREEAQAELAVALGVWADRFLEPRSFTARDIEVIIRTEQAKEK